MADDEMAHHAYTESIRLLLDLITEDTGHGQDSDRAGNYFTLSAFKKEYLVAYPHDEKPLFPKGQVKGHFRTTIAAHLGLVGDLDEIIPYTRRCRPDAGGNKVLVSYAVLGRALKHDARALAERQQPAGILADLRAADATQPLPLDLRRRITSRCFLPKSWLHTHESSQWHDELVQQLRAVPDFGA